MWVGVPAPYDRVGAGFILVPKLHLGTKMVAKPSLAVNAFPSPAWEREEKEEYMMIVFEEVSTLGRGDYIKVNELAKVGPNHSQYYRLKGKTIAVEIGWIGKSIDGNYRYYEPATNELNPTFVEDSLEKMKEKIKTHRSKR